MVAIKQCCTKWNIWRLSVWQKEWKFNCWNLKLVIDNIIFLIYFVWAALGDGELLPWPWTLSLRLPRAQAPPNPPATGKECNIWFARRVLISSSILTFPSQVTQPTFCVQIMVFSTIQTTSDLFTCPISWPKRKTLPWTSFFRARAAARWLSYSTNMYLRQSPLLKYFFLGYLLSFINTLILSLHPLDLVLSACDG